MSDTYIIRPFQPADENKCLDLYNYVFPEQLTKKQWRWLHDENPSGSPVIETAWDNDMLIGFYGLIPMRFYAAGATVKGALSGLAVTHPEYRYKGVFSELGNEVYKRAGLCGIGLIYGFPTEHSRHGFIKKLGWNFVQQGHLLTARGLLVSDPGSSPVNIYRTEQFGREMDTIWNRLKKGSLNKSILAVRDREYLEWRFQRHPSRCYSTIIIAEDEMGPSGYTVVRQSVVNGEKYCCVDDVIAADINTFRKMINKVTELYDTFFYQIRLAGNSFLYLSATGMGFRDSRIKFFFGAKTIQKNIFAPDRQWYFTMADSPDIVL